jgi:hypothetical protein
LISFGVDGVNVFQSTKSNVMKHIHDDYAPYSNSSALYGTSHQLGSAGLINVSFGETH